ncbi:ATP-dependent DNA helicase RecG [Basilea psittacipulmonis]|uniref:ATP-dependent DNA helicase RecG n=1 Tax=Basilea psittacipulmonis DSM 24701 TaxID=1072685 RepID=A0A077DDL3_9BURK|nr:ATP-dependent DNA helicase RecG [Basilea psittacipulmonis]AIL32709.1 ATP-dependent DNA helicase RecG [Basilea psittacipulmonis DSM 24701]
MVASKKTSSGWASKLASMGLNRPIDFLLHLPFRYEDHTHLTPIAQVKVGQLAVIDGTISDIQIHQIRPGQKRLQAYFTDDAGDRLILTWFHFYPNQVKFLEAQTRIRVIGEVRENGWNLQMLHPTIKKYGEPLSKTLTPIYSTIKGVPQEKLRETILSYVDQVTLKETFPQEILKRWNLMGIQEAIRSIHLPTQGTDLQGFMPRVNQPWKRVKIDELVAQQLALDQARQSRLQFQSYQIKNTGVLAQKLLNTIGFKLTNAQERVLAEISQDMQSPYPMHRLLQGDVGAGKTIVAALLACQVIENQYQVAIMAPTEILANQHYDKFKAWFEPLGIPVVWLSGSQKASEKKQILTGLKDGVFQIVVGTQAIIQDQVMFKNLALVISDEQHRFGVGQRLTLLEKGGQDRQGVQLYPHQLSMSATPIPRSLAMTYLSDMTISVIDELPPGRTPVKTKLVSDQKRMELIQNIEYEVQKGSQIYWVCPLVEESEKLQLQAAQETYEQLQHSLPNVRIALIHGRLKADEKKEIMRAFSQQEVDILVATTVIEVGIDVPNASVMVIEHAERFGLAQLHQLRGRVGRGSKESLCVLMFGHKLSDEAKERLKAMYETNDGFEIARRDLEIRGPGEMLGIRQSGAPELRFVNLSLDADLIEVAKEIAMTLQRYPDLAKEHMDRWVAQSSQYLRS